jgi:hypothetical protein
MKTMTKTNGINQNNSRSMDSKPQSSNPAAPQLELCLAGSFPCQSPSARRRRLNRANWWFQRMRQLVDRACDWQPAPEPRPEQIWFPNAHREPATAPHLNSSISQICE